jgi:hypothetical protein
VFLRFDGLIYFELDFEEFFEYEYLDFAMVAFVCALAI